MNSQPSRGKSETCDVVVVGAGGCGLTAALAAAEQGAQVVLLEKTDAPGGNTGLTTAAIAAGSRFQRQAGIEDTPAQLVEAITHRNGGTANLGLTEDLARRSAAVLEWLADTAGVAFEVRKTAAGFRSHSCGGGWALIRCLMAAVEHHENIRVQWSTPALSLELDAQGAATGVKTERGVVMGRTVILATGGFGASPELLSRYIPKAVELPYHGHPGVTGDGLRMGLAAGGATANLDGFLAFPCYFAPLRFPVPQPLAHLGAIMVDRHGRRFADESKFPGGPGARILELPGKHAFEIFDERIYQAAGEALARVVQAKILDTGESPSELATKLGMDPVGLEQTIQRYNTAARQGQDEFGRTVRATLGTPLYGVKIWVALYCTVGGLRVNTNGQVLREDDSVVPNLYAGGDVCEGVTGPGPESYFPGNGQLAALGLGKRAGEHAARSCAAQVSG